MKIMFSAGEASGDAHGASVAAALKQLYPKAELFGMGGELMRRAGVDIIYDIKDLGFIGLVEIVKALPAFFRLRTFLKEKMLSEKPDVLVCIDYPGFNMRLAKVAHDLNIPVVYYICPTIWAWHRSRGKDIARTVTKVASIFPFEAKAYEEFGADVEFVGHPLVDMVHPTMTKEESFRHFQADPAKRNILLMPGSRRQEIVSLLDRMLEGAELVRETHEDTAFYLPRAHTIEREELETVINRHSIPVTITEGCNYDLMQICTACLAASGTATLETALMELPTVLLYRLSPITFAIGRLVVNLPHVGLPNIVAGREVIPELLQGEVTASNISSRLNRLLDDEAYYHTMKDDLRQVKADLGAPGAVVRVAQIIADLAGREEIHE